MLFSCFDERCADNSADSLPQALKENHCSDGECASGAQMVQAIQLKDLLMEKRAAYMTRSTSGCTQHGSSRETFGWQQELSSMNSTGMWGPQCCHLHSLVHFKSLIYVHLFITGNMRIFGTGQLVNVKRCVCAVLIVRRWLHPWSALGMQSSSGTPLTIFQIPSSAQVSY